MAAAQYEVRRPLHAGSWYTDKSDKLAGELSRWLGEAKLVSERPVRAVIVPHAGSLSLSLSLSRATALAHLASRSRHAGYSYSGPTAAFSYKHLNPAAVSRIFVLGPSHKKYTRIAELSLARTYGTPVGDLTLDADVIAQLRKASARLDASRPVARSPAAPRRRVSSPT
jgi:predicted class III extradiol MEMO1 family dioxygenase